MARGRSVEATVSVNEPFVCRCGEDRFVELKRFNKTCCLLPEEVTEGGGLVIQCTSCEVVYRQSPEWEWKRVLGGEPKP